MKTIIVVLFIGLVSICNAQINNSNLNKMEEQSINMIFNDSLLKKEFIKNASLSDGIAIIKKSSVTNGNILLKNINNEIQISDFKIIEYAKGEISSKNRVVINNNCIIAPLNGNRVVIKTTPLNDNDKPDSDKLDFNLYPNPNNGNFNIQFTSNSGNEIKINVHDLRGRSIFNKSYTNNGLFNESLQLNNVQSGIYLVTIEDGAEKEVKKIIVE